MHAAGHMRLHQLPRASGVLRLVAVLLVGLLCIPVAYAGDSPQRRTSRRTRSRAQTKPEEARIKEIQNALKKNGYYSAELTGKWDNLTIAAMKNLQEANGLKPTGKITARSLQALGLGSDVAGLSPPREPVATASAPD